MQPACAEESDAVSFLYGHYQEGKRDLPGMKSKFAPIQVDSILGDVNFTLAADVKAKLTLTQDTWSGATPVATAPSSARGNRVSATHVMTGASGVHGGHGEHNPEGEDGTAAESSQAVTGASPYLFSTLKLDAQQRPLLTDSEGAVIGGVDSALVHTLSSASPEVRNQLDLNITRELQDKTINVGGGFSDERDYESWFGHVAGSWDLNRKLTTVSAGTSYASNETNALLDHDAVPHIYEPYMLTYERRGDDIYNRTFSSSSLNLGEHAPTLKGKREDWGANLGLTHILNKGALLKAGLGYTRSTGYMANPYKAVEVAFIDPLLQEGQAGGNATSNYVYDAQLVALLEQRPDLRNQGSFNLGFVHYIEATDAALHLGYRYFQDDWGIQSHTFEAEWIQPLNDTWSVSPRIRYYSQTEADFYTPYLVTEQGLFSYVTDPVNGALYIDTRNATDDIRYYEDQTGTIAPPTDPNPTSSKYGQPVVGSHGGAIINQHTGLPVSDQAIVDALKQDTAPFDREKLPEFYSSDSRLSGFGTLTAGVTLVKALAENVTLEFGYERMRHAGSLKLGSEGEGSYADFGAYMFNVALNIGLDGGRQSSVFNGHPGHGEHSQHGKHGSHSINSSHRLHSSHSKQGHNAHPAPAGVQFDHMLENSGDMMVGYRLMTMQQGGAIEQSGDRVNDYSLINQGCDGHPCYVRATDMEMRMHMLDVMYAPNDWLNVMLMPQFIDMDMSMRLLEESPRTGGMDAIGMAIMHAEHPHTTSGLGDTELHALIRLLRQKNLAMHMGVGVSAPTGDVDLTMRPMMGNDMGFMEYGMQLGSGTWDFKPSLTFTAWNGPFYVGAQLSGTTRLEDENASGYALGDVIQSTVWGSYALHPSVSASVRGLYSQQQAITGEFNDTHVAIGPGDYTGNYGGEFVDVGVGLSGHVARGSFAGTRWGLEWLQPVSDDPNGYQLAREGTLVFNWGVHL